MFYPTELRKHYRNLKPFPQLGEFSKTVDFKKYNKVVCTHKDKEIVVYANYQMLFNVETCQNEVLDHKILEHDFLDDDLIIEIGPDVRTLID